MTSESKGYFDPGVGALSGGHPIGADGLGSKTIGGAMWGALQVFSSKSLQMLGTLVIAIFVSRDGFGAAGVAISVATFVAIVSPVAVRSA